MRGKRVVVLVLCVLCFWLQVFAQELEWNNLGEERRDVQSVLIGQARHGVIYMGFDGGISKSQDSGVSWRDVLLIKGQNKAVNMLVYAGNRDCIYAATGNGLYRSCGGINSWKRIFKGKDYYERNCIAVAVSPEAIFLGTDSGLFISKDEGRSWCRDIGRLGHTSIISIAASNGGVSQVYVACALGVFKSQDYGNSWEQVFVSLPDEDSSEPQDDFQEDEYKTASSVIKHIAINPINSDSVYIATSKGVYRSLNKAGDWEALSNYGLFSQNTRFVLVDNKGNIYAAAKDGVFGYRNGRWQELSLRLVAKEIRWLDVDNKGDIYVACDTGLFKGGFIFDASINSSLTHIDTADEPSINQVQEAAIKYAEAGPDKIKEWRAKAAQKAWLPQFSVGIDRDTGDLWHWESGSSTRNEDDTLRRGRDSVGWDVKLSWDLGEIIWNNDQTSIDTRSRLMVQLRHLNISFYHI